MPTSVFSELAIERVRDALERCRRAEKRETRRASGAQIEGDSPSLRLQEAVGASGLRRTKAGSAALVLAATIALGGCGGSGGGSNGGGGGGSITIGLVGPFTGQDASFGGELTSGCFAAGLLMNRDGGVLGKTVHCKTVDTHGDAADGVPATEQMIATTGDLGGVLGPTTGEGTAVAPLLNRAKVTMFAQSGDPAFDKTTMPYFWRLAPSDDYAGYAMAVWAHQRGYTRAAAVFGNDIGSQGTVPTLLKAFKKEGGTVVANVQIAPGQSSYRSEVQTVLSGHPQVIFDETDPQSAGTFFSELKQLNGAMLPAIGADPTLVYEWYAAVKQAIGLSDLLKYVTAEQGAATTSGHAFNMWRGALMQSASHVQNPGSWLGSPYSEHNYDAMNIMALAMIEAKSTTAYNHLIPAVTQAGPGKTVVDSFAAGKAALAAGKQIQYVGLGGPAMFNQYHNAPPRFVVQKWDAHANQVDVTTLTADQIAAVAQ